MFVRKCGLISTRLVAQDDHTATYEGQFTEASLEFLKNTLGQRLRAQLKAEDFLMIKCYVLPRPEVEEEFDLEVDMHRRLFHENIVRLYMFSHASEQCTCADRPNPKHTRYGFLLLEPFGATLATWKSAHNIQSISQQQMLQVFNQIGSALAYLHQKYIVHRNINLTTVVFKHRAEQLYTTSGQLELKLMDFSQARQLTDNAEYQDAETRSQAHLEKKRPTVRIESSNPYILESKAFSDFLGTVTTMDNFSDTETPLGLVLSCIKQRPASCITITAAVKYLQANATPSVGEPMAQGPARPEDLDHMTLAKMHNILPEEVPQWLEEQRKAPKIQPAVEARPLPQQMSPGQMLPAELISPNPMTPTWSMSPNPMMPAGSMSPNVARWPTPPPYAPPSPMDVSFDAFSPPSPTFPNTIADLEYQFQQQQQAIANPMPMEQQQAIANPMPMEQQRPLSPLTIEIPDSPATARSSQPSPQLLLPPLTPPEQQATIEMICGILRGYKLDIDLEPRGRTSNVKYIFTARMVLPTLEQFTSNPPTMFGYGPEFFSNPSIEGFVNKFVMIKCFHMNQANANQPPSPKDLFIKELSLLRLIANSGYHASIIPFLWVFQSCICPADAEHGHVLAGQPWVGFMVLEYPGPSLNTYFAVRQEQLNGETLDRLYRKLVSALAFLHRLNIVHNGLNIDNILICFNRPYGELVMPPIRSGDDFKLTSFDQALIVNDPAHFAAAEAHVSYCEQHYPHFENDPPVGPWRDNLYLKEAFNFANFFCQIAYLCSKGERPSQQDNNQVVNNLIQSCKRIRHKDNLCRMLLQKTSIARVDTTLNAQR